MPEETSPLNLHLQKPLDFLHHFQVIDSGQDFLAHQISSHHPLYLHNHPLQKALQKLFIPDPETLRILPFHYIEELPSGILLFAEQRPEQSHIDPDQLERKTEEPLETPIEILSDGLDLFPGIPSEEGEEFGKFLEQNSAPHVEEVVCVGVQHIFEVEKRSGFLRFSRKSDQFGGKVALELGSHDAKGRPFLEKFRPLGEVESLVGGVLHRGEFVLPIHY